MTKINYYEKYHKYKNKYINSLKVIQNTTNIIGGTRIYEKNLK